MKSLVLIPVIALAAACASGSGGGAARNSDRSMLTPEEIAKAGSRDAYTAVQTLRPHWLSNRGPSSFRQNVVVRVYLDGNMLGGPEYLRQITISSVSSIRHMDGLEATQRYGLDHGAGAILVFTREQ